MILNGAAVSQEDIDDQLSRSRIYPKVLPTIAEMLVTAPENRLISMAQVAAELQGVCDEFEAESAKKAAIPARSPSTESSPPPSESSASAGPASSPSPVSSPELGVAALARSSSESSAAIGKRYLSYCLSMSEFLENGHTQISKKSARLQ